MRIPDYYVRFVDFPPTVLGATLPNDDGTFSVYINARLGDDARRETLRHELEHMARDHFYRDAPIAAQEAEARGETVSAVPPAPERGTVRRYRDLAALTAYLRSLGALGSRILKDLMWEKGVDIQPNHVDCGEIIGSFAVFC